MRTPRPRTARAAAALLLPLACLAFAAHSTAQTPAPKDSKSAGSISGRVMTSDGHPAAGLALALMPAEFMSSNVKPAARGATGEDGRYQLAGVPAGRYRLQLLAPAHASPEAGGAGMFNSGRLISVAAGESVEGVDLTVARGGVITGRVTTADGRPVIGVNVNVIRPDKRGPESRAVSSFEFETDDRGVYRVFGLPAGRYLVSVGEDRESGRVIIGAGSPRFAQTFHPATPDAAQARQVEVSPGGEATGVDITLTEGPRSFKAAGRIVDADTGRPIADMGFGHTALVGDGREFGGMGWDGSRTNQNGEFTLKNLVPGRYAAFPMQMGEPAHYYGDPVRFEIVEGDVSGLVIKMRRGSTITGAAVVEGTTDRAVLAKLSALSVYPNVTPVDGAPADELRAPSFSQNKLNPDGTFRLTGVRPGRVRLNVFSFPQQKGFTLLRVERGGVEVPREGFEIGPGEQVSGLRLVIGYGTGALRGLVNVVGGALPAGARMNATLRRAGSTSPGFGSSSTEVDSRGRFLIEGLMAGEYELMVHAFMPSPPGGQQPRFPSIRQNVSVSEAGEASVTLVYDLSKINEPKP